MQTQNEPIKVTDMHSLELEKARLKRLCRAKEEELAGRMDHLKAHYGVMAFNSIFPGAEKERNVWKWTAHAAKGLWESQHLQSILFSALVALLEFIGVRQGTKFIAKYFGKKG